MADSFDQAATQIDTTKRDTLAAMAAAGTQGVAAYQRAQADLAAQQQAAIQGALRQSASINGGMIRDTGEMEGIIGAPYARYQADLTAARGYGEASNAAMAAANAAYFDQAKAAIPALRNAAQIAAAERAAKGAKEASGGGFGDLSDSELRNQLMGAGRLQQEALAALPKAKSAGGLGGFIGKAAKDAIRGALVGIPAESHARRAGEVMGVSPTRAAGLIKMPEPAKAAKPTSAPKGTVGSRRTKTISDLQAKYGDKSTVTQAVQFIVAGASSYAEALAALDEGFKRKKLVTPGGKPLSRRALVAWLKRYYS